MTTGKRHGTVGKIVKHITASVTQQDLTQLSTKIAVRFSTDGIFRIDLPKHVVDWFAGRKLPFEDDREKVQFHAGEVTAKTLERVESALWSALALYREEVKDVQRVKKLVITFQANYRGPRREHGGIITEQTTMRQISSMGFGGVSYGANSGPALGLGFETMWQIGDGLYRVHGEELAAKEGRTPQMTRICAVPKDDPKSASGRGGRSMFLMDWTAEREAFFANATENMNVLIYRIAQMLLGDTTGNVDRLIASGGGMLALPAPIE